MGEELTMGEALKEGEGKEGRERVVEWEKGLPDTDELMPLTIDLIPPCLAAAFSISPEAHKSILDVTRASKNAFSKLRGGGTIPDLAREEEDAAEEEEEEIDGDRAENGKSKRMDSDESENAGAGAGGGKRPRLVWTPQLHKRFVDVVAHLGIKNSVPKTIMQLMNVEGLTRENVASHLQKYRLYLKRQGGSSAAESVPEHSTNSCSTDQSYHRMNAPSFHQPMPMMLPMPMPMPMYAHYQFDGYPSGASSTDHFPFGYAGYPLHRNEVP